MERLVYLLLFGFAICMVVSLCKKSKHIDYVEKPNCSSCALTSLAPERVCPTGMCTQKRGRAGCNV